ncbi:MAG: adenylate/guanylate cyclase domain-containing protein [Actinobacteria bacterium]|nr:adenylate/guanylate cyclase domain-containing protein [Actinomycetota bacterium]
MTPETRYARAGDVHIAYQLLGEGPVDVVLADMWFSNMDGQWDVPPLTEFRRRLASFSRLIMFDRRGMGLSDPVAIQSLPSLDAWMDDLRAVMTAASSDRAALIANIGGAITSLVFAASHPDRLSSLVIVDGFARVRSAPGYPAGRPDEEVERQLDLIEPNWGRGLMLDIFAPSTRAVPGLRETWARFERMAASPGSARAIVGWIFESDVRAFLPTISVPTLVIQHPEGRVFPPALGRYLAEHIPGAKYVELPGPDQLVWAGDQARTVAEIQEFITGVRPTHPTDRVLATVLFTDIVDSTKRAAEMGDHAWRELLGNHDRLARRIVTAESGRVIKSTGDGILAMFDGPARGVQAARELSVRARELDLPIRAGLHAGEVEVSEGDVAGLAVHIGARVATIASADEVLVTSTVKELVIGSQIEFEDRGSRVLKGVPGRWRLFAVTNR